MREIDATAADISASTVVAGIRPAVAITLVEMGLRLDGARVARSLEAALDLFGGRSHPSPMPAAGTGP